MYININIYIYVCVCIYMVHIDRIEGQTMWILNKLHVSSTELCLLKRRSTF